ncbi:PH domain-containing protein [Terrabacter aerolatus]|uniref:PH domain-containing protein n=1 Tax=Terrabacter aerolatus TaxID=422442 RepID=UPI001FE4A0FB|nr:PH domain-containing protein [Terrabacter aerolatus]
MEPLDASDAPDAPVPPLRVAESVLREPAHRVSRRAVVMWTVQALVVVALLLAAQVVWWLVDDAPSRTPHWVVGVVWLAAGAAYAVAMPQWRYRVHRWEATPRAIYTQSGWLWQERRIAPLSRVQTVDLERGPVAQLLGLASVTITTASAAGPVTIHGLDAPVARELVDTLTAAAVTETGDAT